MNDCFILKADIDAKVMIGILSPKADIGVSRIINY